MELCGKEKTGLRGIFHGGVNSSPRRDWKKPKKEMDLHCNYDEKTKGEGAARRMRIRRKKRGGSRQRRGALWGT